MKAVCSYDVPFKFATSCLAAAVLANVLAACNPPQIPAVLPFHAGPQSHQIEAGVQWALQQRATGRAVLVHCAHGHGRSATVLAAVLIAEGQARGVDDAEGLLKAQRPRVRLNARQRAALKQWLVEREVGAKRQ